MVNTTTNYSFNKPEVNSATDEDLWGGYLNDNWDSTDSKLKTRPDAYNFADFEIQRPVIKDYAEQKTTPSSSSGTLTLDLTGGNHFTTTLTEDVTTLTISNPAASGVLMPMTLKTIQDGTGGWAITWPASFNWAGGSAATVTTTASAYDRFSMLTDDGGTVWDANVIGQAFS